MSGGAVEDSGPAEAGRRDAGFGTAAIAAFAGAAALAVAAAVALWASEGARVFAEAAFAAMLACF